MKFETQYTHENNVFSCAGTKVVCVDKKTGEKLSVSGRRYLYKQVYDKQGKRHLVVFDTEDVYEHIQSFRDDTDIYKIVARYFNGDITALDRNKGFYADITDIPKDIHEWQNRIEEGRNIFAGLPTDLKREFGNDLNQFITSVFNQDFEERFNKYVKSKSVGGVFNVGNQSVVNKSNNVADKSDVGGSKNVKSDVGGSKNE